MSLITDAVLVIDRRPNKALHQALTNPMPFDEERGQRFGHLGDEDTDKAGGTKFLTVEIYAAAFNYVGPNELINWLYTLPWGYEHASLTIDSEFEESDDRNCGMRQVQISPRPADAPAPVIAGELADLGIGSGVTS